MGGGCLAGLVVFLLVLISAFCVVCDVSGWLGFGCVGFGIGFCCLLACG